MFGEMTTSEITMLLKAHTIGRIGCTLKKQPYIFPVSFCVEQNHLLCQANEGLKLSMLRKNKYVCFQVDTIISINHWQSVLILGRFEELKGAEADSARTVLYNRIFPTTSLTPEATQQQQKIKLLENGQREKKIMYRINIDEMTGRFENTMKG